MNKKKKAIDALLEKHICAKWVLATCLAQVIGGGPAQRYLPAGCWFIFQTAETHKCHYCSEDHLMIYCLGAFHSHLRKSVNWGMFCKVFLPVCLNTLVHSSVNYSKTICTVLEQFSAIGKYAVN